MARMPAAQDVEDFVDTVSEVSMLIEGLKGGTISPEYVDTKLQKQKQQQHGPGALPAPYHRGQAAGQLQLPPAAPASESHGDTAAAVAADTDAEEAAQLKQEKLMEKVQQLKANRDRKLRARQKYEAHVQAGQGQGSSFTDYTKWNLYCPEDEEDDMFNSMTPNNPAFRAMEKDIDERHNRMVEQRQLAERQRAAGNEAYKAGQYSEALRCYQQGLDAERTNMALHANAAQAALQLQCYVQAIEHCEKVFSIAEFLHNNLAHPLCAKAYMRRAIALRALGQLQRAAADVSAALAIEPTDKQLLQLKLKVDLDLAEYNKQKQVKRALKAAAEGAKAPDAGSSAESIQHQVDSAAKDQSLTRAGSKVLGVGLGGEAIDVNKLQAVEKLVLQLKQALEQEQQPAMSATGCDTKETRSQQLHGPRLPPSRKAAQVQAAASKPTAEQLQELLRDDDTCCVYFRECGGVQAAIQYLIIHQQKCAAINSGKASDVRSDTSNTAAPTTIAPYLDLLNISGSNDGNLLQLLQHQKGAAVPAIIAAIDAHNDDRTVTAAARLLCSASTLEEVRKAVSSCLRRQQSSMKAITSVLCSSSTPANTQELLLQLLGNCVVDAGCKAALQQSLQSTSQKDGPMELLACLEGLIALRSAPALAERALTLLANMCGGEELRSYITRQPSLVQAVLVQVLRVAKEAPATNVGTKQVGKAAATALYNMVTDSRAQEAVINSGRLPALLPLCLHTDAAIAARAVSIVSRCLKSADAAQQVIAAGGLQQLVQQLQQLVPKMTAGCTDEAAPATLDGIVRCLTVLTSNMTDDATDQQTAAQLVSSGGCRCLHQVLALPGMSHMTLGNAALCFANLAKHNNLLSQLADMCMAAASSCEGAQGVSEQAAGVPSVQQAATCLVAALVRTAYLAEGTIVSKNASIALARLAAHPPLLARLKQLRGLEIIHATVKSF